jgi:hypothetical protein
MGDPAVRSSSASVVDRLEPLVRISGQIANVEVALATGASLDEIVGVLIAVAPTIGLGRVVSAAPELALGYDVDAALVAQP